MEIYRFYITRRISKSAIANVFLRWQIIGTKDKNISRKRDESSKKSVNIVAQQITHSFKTDRQTSYTPTSDTGYRNNHETPLSIGLPLTIHKKTRSKELLNVVSHLQIGENYEKIINIEKRIACGVAERMKSTGGCALPSFVKKGKSVFFAADNIDFSENTLHGTILVINQNDVTDDDTDSIAINEPIYIPEYISPINVNIDYKSPPTSLACPVTADTFAYSSNNHFLQKYKTDDRVWLMATFGHRDMKVIQNVATLGATLGEESDGTEMPSQSSTKISKRDIMPTWSGTNSLLVQS